MKISTPVLVVYEAAIFSGGVAGLLWADEHGIHASPLTVFVLFAFLVAFLLPLVYTVERG